MKQQPPYMVTAYKINNYIIVFNQNLKQISSDI